MTGRSACGDKPWSRHWIVLRVVVAQRKGMERKRVLTYMLNAYVQVVMFFRAHDRTYHLCWDMLGCGRCGCVDVFCKWFQIYYLFHRFLTSFYFDSKSSWLISIFKKLSKMYMFNTFLLSFYHDSGSIYLWDFVFHVFVFRRVGLCVSLFDLRMKLRVPFRSACGTSWNFIAPGAILNSANTMETLLRDQERCLMRLVTFGARKMIEIECFWMPFWNVAWHDWSHLLVAKES